MTTTMACNGSACVPVSVTTDHVAVGGRELYTRTLRPADRLLSEEPCLVFLHEGLGCTAMWHDFPQKVVNATRRPALLYDRLGYGLSAPRGRPPEIDYLQVEAETVLPALFDHFGIKAPILIGHSDGGTIALLYAARFPQQVTGVIAEAAHVFVEPVTLDGIRTTVAAFRRRDLEERLARYHGERTREMFFNWADTWLSEAFRPWNIEARLPAIRCDVLVLQGLADRYGTSRQAAAIVRGIGRRASQILIPDCGHAPHREAPRRTLAAIQEFILDDHRPLTPPQRK